MRLIVTFTELLFLFTFSSMVVCPGAAGQINAWQNPSSGDWEVASNWSLGMRPGLGQSVLITNSGWKAVAIGPNAAKKYQDSLAVQTITVSAPTDSFNLLLLNYAGSTPVRANTVTIQSNAALTVLGSTLQVTNTGNTDFRIEVGGTVNQGANSAVATSFLSLGNIGPGVYNLTNGTLIGGTEYVGGSFTGRFEQFGGYHWADLLRVMGFWDGDRGRYELHDGTLSGAVELYGGTLHQTGGSFNGSLRLDGYYVLEGGLYTNAALAFPPVLGDRGSILQTGGTNQSGALTVGVEGAHGGDGYTLSNGVLAASSTTIVFGSVTQWGGNYAVRGAMSLRGGWIAVAHSGVKVGGSYALHGGSASANSVELLSFASVYQNGGSNYISTDLNIGNFQSGDDSYSLRGGSLISSNVAIHGWGWTYFANNGGIHTVSGVLSVLGWDSPGNGTNYYELNGGQLIAREIQVITNGWFVHRSGALLNSPVLTMANGGWQAATGVTELGPLQGTGTILLPSEECVLSFFNSTASTLGPVFIRGWNGSLAGGGQHQIFFGPGGLTPEQLSQIQFIRPNGIDCFACQVQAARLLPSGELVPQPLKAYRMAGDLVLEFTRGGKLETATNVNGPFTDVTGVSSPYTNRFLDPQRFYRLRWP